MSGLVIRENIYPCPLSMANMLTSSESEGTEYSVDDGVLTISKGTATKPYVYFTLAGLNPGDQYTLACSLGFSDEIADSDMVVQIYARDWFGAGRTWQKRDGVDARCPFTVPSDGYVNIRFSSREGVLKVSRINIESTETFDESLPFFYYGTMPYQRSAS